MRDAMRLLSDLTSEELIDRLRSALQRDESEDLKAIQEQVVRRNVGLVKSIALKFLNSGEPLEDLIQAGYMGLLNAVANFNLARNTKFSTYATYLIQGEIRHYIRDKHSTIRIPQWVQTMNRKIKAEEEAFFQREGRPPSLGELAERLDLTEKQLVAVLRGREAMTYVSIDHQRRNQDPNPSPPTIEHLMVNREGLPHDLRMKLLVVIEELSEMQQRIIHGLFYLGKSQVEMGQELGISQRQVSRLKDRILAEMKDNLGELTDRTY